MVLRWLLALLLCSSSMAFAADAYDKALALYKQGKYELALRALESNYNLANRELPLKIATLGTNAAIALKRWKKAERVADAALVNKWPSWPPADVTSKENVRKLKAQPELLPLIKMAAQAKSEIFVAAGDDLNPDAKNKLKAQIKIYTDALTAAGYGQESAQNYWSKVESQPEPVPVSDYAFTWSLLLSYWTWEDRPSFDYHLSGRAVLYTPCLGLGVKYSNGHYNWDGGVCGGVGTGDLQFNDGHFSHASPTLVAGYGSFTVRLSDLGAAIGVEGDVMNVSISGTASNGTKASATNQNFALMAVGRYNIGKLEMKFKGGTIVSSPSALWVFELAYPIF